MDAILSWIANNKEWLFSGLGAIIIAGVIRYFWTRKTKESETLKDSSINQSLGTNIKNSDGNITFTNNKQEMGQNPDKPKR